jgi:glycosyltransferase involved in cell wall biosynthesis
VELVEVCTQLEGTQLHVVGPIVHKFRSHLIHLAQRRDEAKWLHFYGPVDDHEVYDYILRSDIFLLPSHDEAFPNALLEGMALAKPVVVSDVGAMAEMIGHGGENSCGICVEPGNAESLRAGLRSLLVKPECWQVVGRMGRKRVETLYATGPVMDQLIDLWTEATNTGSD